MPKPRLKLVAPTSVNRTVPRRLKNKDLRTREHLTEKEVERLIKAVGENRYGHRDATMVLIAFRHGLRASELCGLQWSDVDRVGDIALAQSQEWPNKHTSAAGG